MKVRYVESKKLGNGKYYGMNYYAEKELGTSTGCKRGEILIDKKLKGTRMGERTIKHEKVEAYHMSKGMPYRKADKIAMKFERN